jgi:crotonobetainyl-CoA:carnitine CoA-transferase CaiB-like acyl-CoA transferase
VRLAPPRLGEHTREVLGEIGFTPDEITAMTEARAGERSPVR